MSTTERFTEFLEEGDLIRIDFLDFKPVHPYYVRVVRSDVLGIVGVTYGTDPLPPAKRDSPEVCDYYELTREHVTLIPWTSVRTVERVHSSRSYDRLWDAARAHWDAQAKVGGAL
jgi:hypothetical protein